MNPCWADGRTRAEIHGRELRVVRFDAMAGTLYHPSRLVHSDPLSPALLRLACSGYNANIYHL